MHRISDELSSLCRRWIGGFLATFALVSVVGGADESVSERIHRGVVFVAAGPAEKSSPASRKRLAIPFGGDGFVAIDPILPLEFPRYTWIHDGRVVPGADRSVLPLRDFRDADSGVYRAEIVVADGSIVATGEVEVVRTSATTATALTPLEFSAAGGIGGVRVDAPAGSIWSIFDVPSWIHVIPTSAAAGSRTTSLEVQPNLTEQARTVVISVAGSPFEIRQHATSGRLANISTRGRAGLGDRVLIAGLVTTGAHPLGFLVRGVGPGLARFDLRALLADPWIDLKQGANTVLENDDWDLGAMPGQFVDEGRRLGAFDLAPAAGDAGLLATLPAGAYTTALFDAAGGEGVALAEFYDRTSDVDADPASRAINISTRGHVGRGDDVLIAGFVVTGSVSKQVVIRGIGPGLALLGVPGPLADPGLALMRAGEKISGNDDWAYSVQRDLLSTAFEAAGAFPLDPESRDAALVATLEPGAYSAILSGADGGTGIGLVEVYDLEVTKPSAPVAEAVMIDLDGNGRSDLWELYEAAHGGDPLPAGLAGQGEAGPQIDTDLDGLSDLEEVLLGTDPRRAASGGSWVGGDLARAVALLSSNREFTLGGRTVRGRLPTPKEAARFLMQASLGGTTGDIAAVEATGFADWMDAQFALEPTYTYKEVLPEIAAGKHYDIHHAWWRQVLTGDDLLRQRMAVAMTEIFVVSEAVINVQWEQARYYDQLGEYSFGNWRDLIDMVTFHPIMGHYLNHLRNRKADPALSRYPDENFAREVMQLFSIGLWELNPDGTRRRDAQGREIPTYDNTDITNFARVFTGLSFSGNGADTTRLPDFLNAPMNYQDRMGMWGGEHDTDSKELLRGMRLPAHADAPGRTGLDDVRDGLDNLFHHPNVGPFFGRLLIQRLVTSNPSPGYIRRVTQAFDDNGHGVRGDMRAMIRAILLDPEARNAARAGAAGGRLREPYLRYVRLARTFKARSQDGTIRNNDHGTLESINQILLNSPSVFNFFLPDYMPPGDMAAAGVYGPEFQIMTSTTAITTLNLYMGMVVSGFGDDRNGPGTLRLDFTEELALADDPAALIDLLDLKMTAGGLGAGTRQILLQAWSEMPAAYTPGQKVLALIQLVTVSPDFAVVQ